MTYKKPLAVLGFVFLISVAGCLGTTTSYSAPPVQVSESIAEEEEYTVASTNQFEFNESVSINNQSYQVQTSNWVVTYERNVLEEQAVSNMSDAPSSSVLGVISTPSVSLAGQELNPLASLPVNELVPRVTAQNQNIEVHEKVGEIPATRAGTEQNFTVSQYSATLSNDQYDMEIDGYVLVATVEVEDAVVVLIGAYPERSATSSESKAGLVRMMENIETVEDLPTVNTTTSEKA